MNPAGNFLALIAAILVGAVVAPAHGATLSINFTNSGSLIGANPAGVGGLGNWNDVYNYALSTDIPSVGNFTLSNGSPATGVKLQIGTGGQYGGATSGASAGDTALMTTGIGGYIFPNGQNVINAVIKLTGLDAVFPYGYSLRLYQIKELNNPNGIMRASVHPEEFTFNNAYNGANPNVYYGNDTTVGFNANVSPFTGAYTSVTPLIPVGAFTETLSVADGGVGHGTLVVTQIYTGGNPNTQFNRGSFAGIQIIGTEAPVPEPSTFVLAGLGLMGLGLVAWRRHRVSAQCH